MSKPFEPFYSYYCHVWRHSMCTEETDERGGCACMCHEIGDDEWWEQEPPHIDDE